MLRQRLPRGLTALVPGVTLMVTAVLPALLPASLAPRIRTDFALSEATLGFAVAVYYIVSALTSPFAGRVVERIGATAAIRASALAIALCGLGIGVVSSSSEVLIAWLVFGAIGNALSVPAVSGMFVDRIDPRRHGLAFGSLQAGAPMAALTAGLALPVVAIPLGWRSAFVGMALVSLAAAFLSPRVVHAPARRDDRAGDARLPRSVVLLAGAAFLASAAGLGLVTFLVTYAVDVGMSEAAAGLLLAAFSVLATVSRVGVGVVADRGRIDPLLLATGMLLVSAAGYALLVVSAPAAIVAGTIVVGALGWAWSGAFHLAVVQRTPGAPARAVAAMMTGLFVGGIAGPLGVGFIAEHGAYDAAWLLCTGLALVAAAIVRSAR